MAIYVCPSRRGAVADRNFDNNNKPPVVLREASAGDYAGNAGLRYDIGVTVDSDVEGNPIVTLGSYNSAEAGPIFTGSKMRDASVGDGLSNTLAFGERYLRLAPQETPEDMKDYEQGDTAFISGDLPRTILARTEDGLATGDKDPGMRLKDPSKRTSKFGSAHVTVTQFVFLDGHLTSISNFIANDQLQGLSTIAGGEVVAQPE